jgi:VWFA-related protein
MNPTIAALACFLLGLSSLFNPAPQDKKPAQATLEHEVTVSLKLIQVYVTDKDGKPVQDLASEDFVLLDGGRKVELTEFEKHVLLPRQAPSAPPAGETAETPAPAPAAPAAPILNRKYFLFFDFAFNSQKGVQRGIEAALHFLDKEVRPEDEVALLSYSMLKGLRFHEYLTGDHDKVKEAINAVTARAIAGRASEIEEAFWRDAQDTTATSPYNWQRQEAKAIAQQYILRLTALARALRSVEGQKNFVFFSSGLPASMIYGNQSGNPTQLSDAQKFDVGDPVLRPLNEELYKELSASNCSFFVFDTRDSAKVPALFDYDIATFEAGGRGAGRSPFSAQGLFQDVTGIFRNDKTTGLDTLKRLSDVTGGKFFSNIRAYPKNLAQVETLTGSYYVLGYYVDQAWDGRYHEVKVEVLRKGCEVRAQAGYYNPKPFRDYSDLEKRLQLFDLALNERSLFQTPKTLAMAALARPEGTAGRVQMLARIPAAALADLGGPEVEIVSLVFDEQAGLADLQRSVADTTAFGGRDITFLADARLAAGAYKCRIVVRNLENGASAVASTLVTVPAPPSGLGLLAPLLIAPETSSVSIEAEGKGGSSLEAWKGLYPFDRAHYAPVLGGLPRGIAKIFVVAPCRIESPDRPPLAVSAFLINAETGERIVVPFNLVFRERRTDFEVLFLEFPAETLAPGRYLLYLHAGDPAAPSLTRSQTAFEILS